VSKRRLLSKAMQVAHASLACRPRAVGTWRELEVLECSLRTANCELQLQSGGQKVRALRAGEKAKRMLQRGLVSFVRTAFTFSSSLFASRSCLKFVAPLTCFSHPLAVSATSRGASVAILGVQNRTLKTVSIDWQLQGCRFASLL